MEVQVLGDGQGSVGHVFERECSVQRRFQKIVEETPSPALDAALREKICETAAGIARSIGYRNAGTVEFIFGQGGEFQGAGSGAAEFYFLEKIGRASCRERVCQYV